MPDPNKMTTQEIKDYKKRVDAVMVQAQPDALSTVMGAVQQAQGPVEEVV